MFRKPFFLVLFVGLLVPYLSMAASAQDTSQFIDGIAKDALNIIKSTPDKQQKQNKLEALFSGHVDIPWIGRFVLGRFWKQATPEQQSRYLTQYRDFIISHYTSHLTDYSNGNYHIVNSRKENEDEFLVSMKIEPPDKDAFEVDYRVRASGQNELKIYDIVIEGVSLISTQRSEFTSVVQNKGLDALTQQLQEKTKEVRYQAF